MVKILVLGSAGMLGSQVVKTLTEKGYQVTPFKRKDFDAYKDNVNQMYTTLRDHDYVLNCIGVIKPFMEKSLITSITKNSCRNKRNCLTFILVLLLTTLWN